MEKQINLFIIAPYRGFIGDSRHSSAKPLPFIGLAALDHQGQVGKVGTIRTSFRSPKENLTLAYIPGRSRPWRFGISICGS